FEWLQKNSVTRAFIVKRKFVPLMPDFHDPAKARVKAVVRISRQSSCAAFFDRGQCVSYIRSAEGMRMPG
ncbi:MAG TPA: hypothetical protein VKH44_01670, partial [Pirellulaceae bacterium]|nr:hypothetical protein [Pirellulaceae bacterium]